MSGYIYLVISEEQSLGKVGYCSDSPKQRLVSMQTGNPSRLRLESYIPGTRAQEGFIHQELAFARQTGEWFRDPTMLSIIFDVLHSAAMNVDDVPEEMADGAFRLVLKEALDEALHGVE